MSREKSIELGLGVSVHWASGLLFIADENSAICLNPKQLMELAKFFDSLDDE